MIWVGLVGAILRNQSKSALSNQSQLPEGGIMIDQNLIPPVPNQGAPEELYYEQEVVPFVEHAVNEVNRLEQKLKARGIALYVVVGALILSVVVIAAILAFKESGIELKEGEVIVNESYLDALKKRPQSCPAPQQAAPTAAQPVVPVQSAASAPVGITTEALITLAKEAGACGSAKKNSPTTKSGAKKAIPPGTPVARAEAYGHGATATATTAGGATPSASAAPAPLAVFSGTVCRARSDGTVRLEGSSRTFPRDEILAISHADNSAPNAKVVALMADENCAQWRSRVARDHFARGSTARN